MKEEYLKQLRKALFRNSIDNAEEIYDKYRRRYEFGLEAELSEEEIEKQLGTIDEIISKYRDDSTIEIKEIKNKETETREESEPKNDENIVKHSLFLKVVSDSLTIKHDDSVTDFTFKFEDTDSSLYEIIKEDGNVNLNYKDKSFFSFNRKNIGDITLLIPSNFILNEVRISNLYADIDIDYLEAEKITFINRSGNYDCFSYVKSPYIEINNCSGDYLFDEIVSKNIIIHNLSGDVDIFTIKGNVEIANISGDVDVDTIYGTSTVNNITGEVNVMNKSSKSVTSKASQKVMEFVNDVKEKLKKITDSL